MSYSIQEWLLLMLPSSMIMCCPWAMTIVYYNDPTSIQFIYTALPPSYQTPGILSCCIIYETFTAFYAMSIGYLGIFTILAFIQGCSNDFDSHMLIVK